MSHEDDVMKLMRIGFELLLKELNIEYHQIDEDEIDTESNFKSKELYDGGNLAISSKTPKDKLKFIRYQKGFYIPDDQVISVRSPFIQERVNETLIGARLMFLTLKKYTDVAFSVVKYDTYNYNITGENTYMLSFYVRLEVNDVFVQKFDEMNINDD